MIHCENGHVTCKGNGKELLEDLACIAKAVASTMREQNISERKANMITLCLVYSALSGGVKKADNEFVEIREEQ